MAHWPPGSGIVPPTPGGGGGTTVVRVSGDWFYPIGQAAPGTVTPAALGTMEASPWICDTSFTLDSVQVEVTTAGGVGAVQRLGAYADGGGYPGALVADFGTVPVDAIALPVLGGQSAKFSAGTVYWLTTVVQGNATVPTMRNHGIIQYGISIRLANGNPPASAAVGYYRMRGPTGATTGPLPDPFPTPVILAGTSTRMAFKVA